MVANGKKRGLTGWEKTAIIIIVILIFIILTMIFKDQLEEYFRTFMEWYASGS